MGSGADGSGLGAGERGPVGSTCLMASGSTFDTKDSKHRMLVGVIQISSGTYYIDESAECLVNNLLRSPEGGWHVQSSGAFSFRLVYHTKWKNLVFLTPAKPSILLILENTLLDGKDYYFDEVMALPAISGLPVLMA